MTNSGLPPAPATCSQQEWAGRKAGDLAGEVSTEPSVVTVGVGADQVRRHRQPLKVLKSERPLPIRG